MVVKKKEKGQRTLRRCFQDFFQSDNFLVGTVEKSGLYGEKDLFGLFDFVYIDREFGVANFCQVTTNKPHSHKKFLEFASEWIADIEQYVWYNRKGWRVFTYISGEEALVKDYDTNMNLIKTSSHYYNSEGERIKIKNQKINEEVENE